MKTRQTTERKTFKVNRNQFQLMQKKAENFPNDIYSLLPIKEGKFNCVKATAAVSASGGIDYLQDVFTPFAVAEKIRKITSYIATDTFIYAATGLSIASVFIFVICLVFYAIKWICQEKEKIQENGVSTSQCEKKNC